MIWWHGDMRNWGRLDGKCIIPRTLFLSSNGSIKMTGSLWETCHQWFSASYPQVRWLSQSDDILECLQFIRHEIRSICVQIFAPWTSFSSIPGARFCTSRTWKGIKTTSYHLFNASSPRKNNAPCDHDLASVSSKHSRLCRFSLLHTQERFWFFGVYD